MASGEFPYLKVNSCNKDFIVTRFATGVRSWGETGREITLEESDTPGSDYVAISIVGWQILNNGGSGESNNNLRQLGITNTGVHLPTIRFWTSSFSGTPKTDIQVDLLWMRRWA